jgi:YbgC/YbaW family acyl-CoA thioester hydrolase
MYPVLKFANLLLKARFREKLLLGDSSVLHYRVGLTDVDMFGELNNARYLNYMELGRWDFSYRTGFMDLMKAKKWGVAVGGASIRYRRRIPFLGRFSVTSKLLCHDGRWFYFLQEFHRQDRICASALMKVCATSKQGLVPAAEVLDEIGAEMEAGLPDWVAAWVAAEGLRPWPRN